LRTLVAQLEASWDDRGLEDNPCDHDVDILDVRARCRRCGDSGYVSDNEVLHTIDSMAAYAAYAAYAAHDERENRR
jgi:hypothetical protein